MKFNQHAALFVFLLLLLSRNPLPASPQLRKWLSPLHALIFFSSSFSSSLRIPTPTASVSLEERLRIIHSSTIPLVSPNSLGAQGISNRKGMRSSDFSGEEQAGEIHGSPQPVRKSYVERGPNKLRVFLRQASENGEGIHVLHYEHGQKYETHPDYFVDKFNQENGGNRMATVLMYLSNVRKGGETVFPYAEAANTQLKDETYSECARNGFAVKPKKGDALLFFSCHINATTNPRSVHRSCPVIEGQKWAATRWIRLRSFENSRRNKIQ